MPKRRAKPASSIPRNPTPAIFDRRRFQRRNAIGQFARYGTYIAIRSIHQQKGTLAKIASLNPPQRAQVIPPSRRKKRVRRAPQREPPPPPPPPPGEIEAGDVDFSEGGFRKVSFEEEGFGRPGVKRFTYFRAQGTIGDLDDYQAELFFEALPEFPAMSSWFSNQSGLFGQVKFEGDIPADEMLSMLNQRLQFRGEEFEGFDFREVYPQWRYKYQVVEFLGGNARVVRFEEDGRE